MGQNFTAMLFLLPALRRTPEFSAHFKEQSSAEASYHKKVFLYWDEDSKDKIEIAKFLSIQDHIHSLQIMKNCWMKGRKQQLYFLLYKVLHTPYINK